jgi:hypothetical protein
MLREEVPLNKLSQFGRCAAKPTIASTQVTTKRFVLHSEGVKNAGLVAKQVTEWWSGYREAY